MARLEAIVSRGEIKQQDCSSLGTLVHQRLAEAHGQDMRSRGWLATRSFFTDVELKLFPYYPFNVPFLDPPAHCKTAVSYQQPCLLGCYVDT